MSNKIKKDDPRLTAFVLGELSPSEAEQIQNAISSSPELAGAVEEIRMAVDLLGTAYQSESPLALLDQQKSELARAASAATDDQLTRADDGSVVAKSTPLAASEKSRLWLPIAIAASLIGLLVGGAFYFDLAGNAPGVASKVKLAEQIPLKANQQDEVRKVLQAHQDLKNEFLSATSEAEKTELRGKLELFESRMAGIETAGKRIVGQDGFEYGAAVGGVSLPPAPELLVDKTQIAEMRNRMDFSELSPAAPYDDFDRPEESRSYFLSEGEISEVVEADRLARADAAYLDGFESEDEVLPSYHRRGLAPATATPRSSLRPRSRGSAPAASGRLADAENATSEKLRLLSGDRVSRAMELAQLESQVNRARQDFQAKEDKLRELSRFSRSRVAELEKDADLVRDSKADSIENVERRIDELKAQLGSLNMRDAEASQSTNREWEEVQNRSKDIPKAAKPQIAGGAAAGGAIISGTTPSGAAKSDLAENEKARQQIKDLGLELVTRTRLETKTRMVPRTRMTTETKTRSVPVTRTRLEDRTRVVNGKEETYQVSVPYTENVTQNYTVQVPVTVQTQQSYQISVPYYSLGLPQDNADKLIADLASNLDPGGKTEFKLEELIQRSAQSWEESDQAKAKKAAPPVIDSNADNVEPAKKGQNKPSLSTAQSQRLVLLLSRKLAGESKAEGKKLGFDVLDVLKTLDDSLAKRNAEIRKTRTWKRVKAVPNATRLMVGDKDELDLTGMQVNVQVDGFRARVLIDCFYYNDRANQLEGNFKLRLPDDASLYYFAFGESAYDFQPKGELAESEFLDDGTQFVSLGAPEIRQARKDAWAKVKEARMVPREKAAHAYRETVRRKVDPALVEWAGAGVFNARVFPLAPQKLHRIVIGYDVNLTKTDEGWTYQLDLPQEPGQCQVDLNIQPVAGVEYDVTPDSDPLQNVIQGKSHQRYQFLGKQENGIQVTASKTPQILLRSSDDEEGDFWGIQIKPELPVEEVAGSPVGIFMVDTSLSSNPDKFNVWLEMLRSTLTNNRDSLKHFNVLFFNVDGHFWKDGYVANTAENVEQLMETCDTLALEGATDLYGAIEQITSSEWAYRSPESSQADESTQRPDLFLLSDGAATWGETNLRLIGRQIADNNLGSLFAYQTGLTGTSISSLRFLADQSGGAVFSVATEDEIKTASTAHRKRPWKLKSVSAAGATDTMTAGRVQWVYPGQSLTIVGRGELDGSIELELDQASDEKTILIPLDQIQQIESELASRLYGQVAVGQLESLGAKVFDVAASYARHFRVTGKTCSLLMLETEADYERFDIKPKEDLFVIKSKVAKDLIASTLKKSADKLADPKAQTLAWLERLETMPGMSFKMPTALKLAMDEIEIVAISKPLECSLTRKDKLSQGYLAALGSERLDYEKIAVEAKRRGGSSVDEAIKVFSSLVERSPGDIVIARDVAFTAMELDRPAQAYHLLRRVALARPFQGSIYPALGQCLTQLGQSDMAIVYYEVALGGKFSRQGANFKQIVSTEYMHLLRQIKSGKLESSVPDFAAARLETMEKNARFDSAGVVITMMWNTDQTDVDLHVVEPSGEECSYENKKTRSGGQITSDITTGFGPEMYFNAEAPEGKYEIKVKYFGKGQNRTGLRNKVHLMIYRDFGAENEKLDRRTVELKTVGEKESVATIGID